MRYGFNVWDLNFKLGVGKIFFIKYILDFMFRIILFFFYVIKLFCSYVFLWYWRYCN